MEKVPTFFEPPISTKPNLVSKSVFYILLILTTTTKWLTGTTTAVNTRDCTTTGIAVKSQKRVKSAQFNNLFLGLLIGACVIAAFDILLVALIIERSRTAKRIIEDVSAYESTTMQPIASRTLQKTKSTSSETQRHEDNDRVVESIEQEAAIGGGGEGKRAGQQAHGYSP